MRSLLSHPSRLWSLSLVACGTGAEQNLRVFSPEQEFSEPGPVILFLHGNGLSEASDIAPDSDGLICSHIGKLGAMFGGIGITANYRSGPAASLATGAEDLALIVAWIRKRVADFGGDPDTSSCWQIPTARRLLRDTC
jgi:carboxylesterase type B